MQKISIVIPAKNETLAIGSLVKNILCLPGLDCEILVIDDGSSDDTKDVALSAGAKVISHPYSKGNGAAIKTGAQAANGDIIIFMDADGQHNPEDVIRLLAGIHSGYDMMVGARVKGSQASAARGFANKIYNFLSSAIVGHKIEDLTSGLRAVRRDKFLKFLYLLPNGFSYPTTITMAFFRAGFSVGYMPIIAATRQGKSHIRPIKDGVRFLLIIFKIATLYSPLKLFFPASVLLLLGGLAHYAYVFFTRAQFTNMSALLFLSSLTIFLVGLVSEQVTALMYRDQ